MTTTQRLVAAVAALAFFALPALASAAALSTEQATAIVGLIRAFGAEASVLLSVERILGLAPAAPPAAPHVPVTGSPYKASNLGFDYSYNAPLFPPTNFGFGIVGVSSGKSFTQNPRIDQEVSWARFGAGAAPTLYINLNAPYGSTVAGNVSSPESCTTTTIDPAGDPTACAGYNYGYNAAAYALAYAKSHNVSSQIWWLDIEEANSWSADTSVNDQVIQGAIDYLNSQGLRAGIYSMAYMWNRIAGAGFVPAQTIGGRSVSTPTWIPLGINDQIGAADACAVIASFIPGSPVWLVQYVASATAVDQNFSC
jgi:hypothetical protein